MPDIKDSVGHGGTNKVHDVALLEAMLRVVKDAKHKAFFSGEYDGGFTNSTKTAIIHFQKEHGTGAATASPTHDAFGMVTKDGPTIKKINAVLGADFKDIRIIENTRTVYWPMALTDSTASQAAINGKADLDKTFRTKVAQLVQLMFDRHKIALSVTDSGWRRTFQKQYELATQPTPPTKAGPGESNHNFGLAVDIGFKGWKWMRGNGTSKVDDWWLNSLVKVSAAKAREMWAARDKIGFVELSMFPSALAGDLIHVQKFSDANTSMRLSLADLMNRKSIFYWSFKGGQYHTDLGLGGDHYSVGNSKQIWEKAATLSKEELAKALTKSGTPTKASSITAKDIKEWRQKLREEMELAETHGNDWLPIASP